MARNREQTPEKKDEKTIIPVELCPTLKLLGKGKTVFVRVEGVLTEQGLVIANVDLLR